MIGWHLLAETQIDKLANTMVTLPTEWMILKVTRWLFLTTFHCTVFMICNLDISFHSMKEILSTPNSIPFYKPEILFKFIFIVANKVVIAQWFARRLVVPCSSPGKGDNYWFWMCVEVKGAKWESMNNTHI